MKTFNNICIIGGGGHVGCPLGLMLASYGKKVYLYEKNKILCNKINSKLPTHYEINSNQFIKKYFKNYQAGYNDDFIRKSKVIVICVGTPVSKNSKPKLLEFYELIYKLKKIIRSDQLIIIRSSVFPGTIEKVARILKNVNSNISYCPERILQGSALVELKNLPQIVSGVNKKSVDLSVKFFKIFNKKIIISSILEAELIKLFSNAWRYINFAISNQFYAICQKFSVDFNSIRKKMVYGYSRNKNLPMAGFAAGPCLVKDTMQLMNFCKNNFSLGKDSLEINMNFPMYIVQQLEKRFDLKKKKIGILGLAFKSDVDDTRDSLSLELIKVLQRKKIKYYFSDSYCDYPGSISANDLIKKSDIIIVATPHKHYKNLKIKKNKILIDTWGLIN